MQASEIHVDHLFDLTHTLAQPLLAAAGYPWQALPQLQEFILELGPRLGPEFQQIAPQVWVGQGCRIDPLAAVRGPAILGHRCEVRPGAYIREAVLVGDDCILGNSCEFKNAILFDGVLACHFNYVGDAILGFQVHLGAGVILSNVKAGLTPISVHAADGDLATGLIKFSALLGDFADIGSQTVLNPGTVVGRRSVVYPLLNLRGLVEADTIVKSAMVRVPKRP